ncbi:MULTISPECIES: NAD(P)-dependent oxidoreductase [unclassified Streptomyces]|uniref:NAD(P)-dependent oxidoreductase n=1 Tax=unclassified Streptomyces TaxID=2593676 RepID=UPI0006AE6CC9|nr:MULTISPECIES: NAD(P)-binding domain-containing protein [unclassified Streptomyces]KOX33670.1 6-phosphogluconate dehydrogenase [Streptomyces sp. NRRL F-6491]KOX37139.1 6-phosphogluconate dehydrogenase [Streptomyces sp. NRRL F-6492]
MPNTNGAQAPVTVIGLGLMGRALAAAFLEAGHPTTVWNRTAAKADRLVAEGAVRAGSVGDAIAASPLVVVCVTDYAAVRELLGPSAGSLGGKVVANLTTGTSAQARETAEWAAGLGARYLDGAIMAIPADIATDAAVLLHSGPKEAFEEHEATLRALGAAGTTYLDTDPGLSALYDMSLLGIMWGVLNGFLQGAALLGTAKVRATAFAPLANTMIKVVTEYVTAYAPQIDEGVYPADDATVTVHRDALGHLAEESEKLGVNAELPRFFKALTDRAATDGHADSSYAALIEQFRKPAA